MVILKRCLLFVSLTFLPLHLLALSSSGSGEGKEIITIEDCGKTVDFGLHSIQLTSDNKFRLSSPSGNYSGKYKVVIPDEKLSLSLSKNSKTKLYEHIGQLGKSVCKVKGKVLSPKIKKFIVKIDAEADTLKVVLLVKYKAVSKKDNLDKLKSKYKVVVVFDTVELECEASGEPCALSEVPLEVLERGEEFADLLLQIIEDGMSFADARTWLSQQEGVVDAEGDDTAIIFRVDGGRDVWIVDDITLASVLSTSPEIANPTRSVTPLKAVVGDTPATKHALILAPFKHAFGIYDSGNTVKEILKDTRGYSGNVRYEENATEGSTQVGISDFKSWDDYDVVHVSSHGKTICIDSVCSAVIYTGDSYGDARELLDITEVGVNTVHVVAGQGQLFTVGADFFRKQYPGGLKRTIVFIDACETFGAGDYNLGLSIIGDDSVYLGWSAPVHSDVSQTASSAMFRGLSENGVTVEATWRTLGDIAVDNYMEEGKQVHAELLLSKREGKGLRLREIVFLEHPKQGGTLSDGVKIPFVGKAGDGIGDVIPYQVMVDGIKEDDIEGFVVTVMLDGEEGVSTPLSEAQQINENSYRIYGDLMFRDLTGVETLMLRAVATLPDQGISEHGVSVIVGESVVVDDSGESCPGIPTISYAEETYNTVQISSQCWLKDNLNAGTMITTSQDQERDQINNGTIEKYCYDNVSANCDIFGGLYQWDEAMQYSGSQDICPEDWHIPTLADFETLKNAVNSDGNSLKSIGEGSGSGTATNTNGFSALLAGYVFSDVFSYAGDFASFWSSTELGSFNKVNSMFLSYFDSEIGLASNAKSDGFSVRCVMD
jgi:uncharacterized protein (TIGR02145 family)